MSETWLPAVGYEEHYEVSDLGRVRRIRARTNTYAGKVLKPHNDGGGYPSVELCAWGARRRIKVHRLVARAFLGPCPEDMEVNHKDGVRSNAAVANLEYVTKSENKLHSIRLHGVVNFRRGETHGNAKLTTADVAAIRTSSEPHLVLAGRFGVSRQTIGKIKNGDRWPQIELRAVGHEQRTLL